MDKLHMDHVWMLVLLFAVKSNEKLEKWPKFNMDFVYVHTYWISLILMEQYQEYLKFALKSMDIVHMGHVQDLHNCNDCNWDCNWELEIQLISGGDIY